MSCPPTSGPITVAMPDHAVHEPIAAPRWAGGKAVTITASAAGESSAPNIPCSTRPATITSMLGAIAHTIEATPESETPIENTRRSPNTSPSDPPIEDQRGQREQVAVRDPLLAREATAEVLLDRRQRDVDDRGVEPDDERAHDRGEQAEALDAGPLHAPTPREATAAARSSAATAEGHDSATASEASSSSSAHPRARP